ncbi:MAG: hypothetical protein HFP76_05705 [Methylococcales symbiont of Iophon sp. n. MRB-2018]|nr:MAG: hypothetical protein HFP76_05705 [Methylococcales symbiont of Iophon sp. n. MRB-2018]
MGAGYFNLKILNLELNKSINTIEYVGQQLTGLYASEVLTILTYFGQQADVKTPVSFQFTYF